MPSRIALMAAGLMACAGAARASECGEQIRVLDDRYSLAVLGPETGRAPDRAATATEPAPSGRADATTNSGTGMDTPNTGGVATPRNSPVEPVEGARRDALRDALLAAKRADDAGDGTTCADRVAAARRLIQSPRQ
jgi:hypothetical protein